MTLSEAIKAKNGPLADKLLKEALERFADELSEEFLLQRTHIKPISPSGQVNHPAGL
jgi:hypothetical protein